MTIGKTDRSFRNVAASVAWLVLAAWILVQSTAWAAPPGMPADGRQHVALDPGHGGDDVGARGPTGALEKDVSLELARALALLLEESYRVTLTRGDDYHVPLRQRAAIANQARAQLFISLHTAAGFLHATRGAVIYVHKPVDPPVLRPGAPEGDAPPVVEWRRVQERHETGSRALAQALKPHLANLAGIEDVRIAGAPLAVLEGADMPAVLVEVGHITNPATEQRLTSPQDVEALARAIQAGIDTYFQSIQAPSQ